MAGSDDIKPESTAESKPILEDSQQNKSGWSPQLLLAGSAAAIGSSFQFGYNSGVINIPGLFMKDFFNETYFNRYGSYIEDGKLNFLWGVTVSIFAIGGMIGSLIAGYFAKRWGRKKSMLINNLVVVIGAALMGFSKLAQSYEMLIIGRFIVGINSGINTALSPMYLTEIAPIHLRGIFGISNQFGIVIAFLISEVLGLPNILGTADDWPVLLALCLLFSAYQLIVLPFCPETPTYLLSKGRTLAAVKSLQYLRNYDDVSNEINALLSEQNDSSEDQEQKVSVIEIFKRIDLRKPMIIAIVLQLAQQLSGINAALYYSSDMFVEITHVSHEVSGLFTVGMGVANVIMCFISLFLVDRFGRRILLLVGLGGMCINSIFLVISLTVGQYAPWGKFVAIIATILYVMAFQTGPGSIPWFITAELFNDSARTTAMSIAGVVNWTGNFLVGISYPTLQSLLGGYTFIIFSCLLLIFWLFTYFKVPETKGKSIEEITNSFKID